jgi:hypothetical protein
MGMTGLAFDCLPDIVLLNPPFHCGPQQHPLRAGYLRSQIFGSSAPDIWLIGAAFVTPVALAYSAFVYWVFRRHAREESAD